jgi:hypothetical protein
MNAKYGDDLGSGLSFVILKYSPPQCRAVYSIHYRTYLSGGQYEAASAYVGILGTEAANFESVSLVMIIIA